MQSSERSMRSSRKPIPEQMLSPGPENQSDTGQYMCIECSETFDTRLELNSHRQSHVIKKQFTCRQCGRGFHHQVFLQMHERSHEDGGSGVKTPPVRVISTRSSKMADVVHVKPTYTKPQHLLNSIVKFKNEQKVCQTFTPKEFVTRRSHGAASPVSQQDSTENSNVFELRISKFSDTTVHVIDSFGNSIEILADVFNTYTIGEPEETCVTTKTSEESPSTNASDDTSSKSFTENPSVSPQTKPSEMDSNLPPRHESATSESITSKELHLNDADLPPRPESVTAENPNLNDAGHPPRPESVTAENPNLNDADHPPKPEFAIAKNPNLIDADLPPRPESLTSENPNLSDADLAPRPESVTAENPNLNDADHPPRPESVTSENPNLIDADLPPRPESVTADNPNLNDADLPPRPESVTAENPNLSDVDLPPRLESVTVENPNLNDADLPVTALSATPEQKRTESRSSSETIELASDKESSQSSSVSQESVDRREAVGSIHAEDHMDTSSEDAVGPTFAQETLFEIDQTAKSSSTSITSTADEPTGSTNEEENSSPIGLLVELPNKRDNQSLLDEPDSSGNVVCSVPETSEEHKQPEEFAGESNADAEQNQGLTLLKPDAELGQASTPPVDSPPERPDLPSAVSDKGSAYSLPLESSDHEQSGNDDVNFCETLSMNRDDVSSPTENTSGRRSAEELGTLNKEITLPSPDGNSERTDVGTVIPVKPDLQSASVQEKVGKNINLETDTCMTPQDVAEASISEGEVCSPARDLQVDSKESEKPCSMLAGQDILRDDELAIDDKREDDLFERDIFPLETPMEVCEKGLASMEEEQTIVCGSEAQRAKIVQEKESDICLNNSDMAYISESEMIKLLEQDKDDVADDEPMAASQKELENEGLSNENRAFSEPDLSNNTKEPEPCRSPVRWDGEQKTVNDELTSKLSKDTAEVQHSQIKATLQAPLKEKDNDSCLPLILTNDEPRTEDNEPQDPTESMSTQDSVSNPSEQLSVTETSSSSTFQPLTKESKPDLPQPEQDLPCGDQNYVTSPEYQAGSPALPRTEHANPEEDNDVLVTVEDNECDDKEQQIDPLESSSMKDGVIESGHGKPYTGTPGHKGLLPDTLCNKEPGPTNTIEGVGESLPDHDRETKQICNQENPSQNVLDSMQSTRDDGGDPTNASSSDRTDLKNEGICVESDAILLVKNQEKSLEDIDVEEETRTQEQTNLERFSKTELSDLPTAKIDVGDLEGDIITKDIEGGLEEPSVDPSKAIDDDLVDDGQPVRQQSVEDALEDSELLEDEHQDEAETPSKLSGAGGECLKCGRKMRRGRKEMVRFSNCFKCRKAAKKQERLSSQGLNVALGPRQSRKEGSLSDSRIKQDEAEEDISDESPTVFDPLVAVDEAAKKMYECPKCDEVFRIPALLAGHIKCHTLPQCLTCGCPMRLKYKTKRVPRRCQKCCQQLKEKKAERKLGEGSGHEYSDISDNEDAFSLADINPDDDVSDEDSHVEVQKANRKPLKADKPGSCDPSQQIDDVLLSESPDEGISSSKKVKGITKKKGLELSDELDTSDSNIGLPDGEKPRLCSQCGKAFPCNRSLNLHLLSHSGVQCESCGCRLPKKRRVGRWSRKCRSCRFQIKEKLVNDSEHEISPSGEELPKQMNVAPLRLKAKQSKNAKIQSIIKKKKELKWMNMLLAVKGLMDKSRKKKENALKAADLAKKEGESSEAEKGESSAADNASIQTDQEKSDPEIQEAGPSELPCPPDQAPSGTPKPGRKCLYKEKNIIKVEENDVPPYVSTAASNATPFIKQEEMWQCLECNQSWPNCEALVNHQHSHTSSQSLTCPRCPQIFSSEQYLNAHIPAHDEERPFRCPECDKTFTKRNHLGVHMRVHTGSRPFACPDCPCRFRQKVTLIAHRYSHRNYQLLFSKPFQCSVCSKSFKQKERLVVHERLHTGECPFSCKDCDKVFPSKARLYVHRKLHKICDYSSSSEQTSSNKEASEGQPFKCQDCGKICSTKASFVLHRKVHRLSSIPVQSIKHEENEEVHAFTCKDCIKVFSSKASLSMHLKNHSAHKSPAKSEMSPDLKQRFPCKVCGKVCSTKASLVLHRKVHNSPSTGEQNLLVKVESDAPSYVCIDCNKVCSTKASFVLHRRVHKTAEDTDTESPSFRCKKCDMVFPTKTGLVLHRKVHRSSPSKRQSPKADGESPSFSCKHCDMVCSTKASFVLHSRKHKSLSTDVQDLKADAGQQSFNCKHCDMVCSTKASFVLHSKVHRVLVGEESPKVGEKSQLYNCKHCDMVCSTKASFVLHSKVHRSLFGDEQSFKTPEEPQSYNCKKCDMVCSTKASFVLHSKVHRLSSVIPQSPKAAEELKPYSCKECDMVCSTKASFVLHSKVHKSGQNVQANTEGKSFTCKVCDKVCSTKASFILHRKVHKSSSSEHSPTPKADGEEPPLQCKECGKIFSSKGRLAAHSKVHEDSSGGDQNADNESNAEQAKKTSEEKPYSCPICDLRFLKLKMLVRHKAVHGERTVTPCIHCGKHFLYMKSLFNHIKICQSKSKRKKLLLLKKAAAKRKLPKDGGSTSSDGESTQKKRKTGEKQKALTAAQKLKNKNLTVKAKKTALSKEKGKGTSVPQTKEKQATEDNEAASESEGKKTSTEKQNDGKEEKPFEQPAKEPTPKKSVTKEKKVKKEPSKDKPQKVVGAKKWRVLASTVKKKNLQAVLIGGKKKLLLKKKVQLKPKAGGKAGKD